MSESVLAASDFSLETSWKKAEMGTLSPFECLSFANTIQADLPTYAENDLGQKIVQVVKSSVTKNLYCACAIPTLYGAACTKTKTY